MGISYYELLGVPESANAKEIQAAYRANVAKYHPDVNNAPNATRLAALLNEAWETLRDRRRRAEYDASLKNERFSGTNAPPPPPPQPPQPPPHTRHQSPPVPPWSNETMILGAVPILVIFVAAVLLFGGQHNRPAAEDTAAAPVQDVETLAAQAGATILAPPPARMAQVVASPSDIATLARQAGAQILAPPPPDQGDLESLARLTPADTTGARRDRGQVSIDDVAPRSVHPANGIRRQIDNIRKGRHLPIPPAQAGPGGSSDPTSVQVNNATAYTLFLFVSGPLNQTVQLVAGDSTMIVLSPGNYEIAARVSNPHVIPLYGKRLFEANTQYSEEFYIAAK